MLYACAMRPPMIRMIARILSVRCPRCGEGPIFRSAFIRAERCSLCDWKFEREHGYWIGGSEVHMFASYGISVLIFIPLLILLGSTPAVQVGVVGGHVVCSLLLFRYSRAFFIGLDFYVDPGLAEGDNDGDDEGVPVAPRPRHPFRRARQNRRKPAIESEPRPAREPARTSPR